MLCISFLCNKQNLKPEFVQEVLTGLTQAVSDCEWELKMVFDPVERITKKVALPLIK